MSETPLALISEIVKSLAKEGFRYLGPFIAAGRTLKNIACFKDILKEVNLDEFLKNPSFANEGSIYRPFFAECLRNDNIQARYLESIRLLVQKGPHVGALEMLILVGQHSFEGRFALGIFLLLTGNFSDGLMATKGFLRRVGDFNEATRIAELVKAQIADMGTSGKRLFRTYSHYGMDFLPACRLSHCERNNICRHCFAWHYTWVFDEMC